MNVAIADLILDIAQSWRDFSKSELMAGRVYDPDEACVAIAGHLTSKYRIEPLENTVEEEATK